MKYAKEAVVARIEDALVKMQVTEERRYQEDLKKYRDDLDRRNRHRMKLFQLVDNLKGIRHGDRVEDDRMVDIIREKFAEVGKLAHGYSTYGEEYIGQVLGAAGAKLVEPVKITQGSDELTSVLNVFKTGAPPEVGVNDLRAFGLMSFLKYRA